RLSIGMPVYNAERYLARAIESLLAQTFDDFELIISDNASTDATQSICRRFAERDRRIRYVRQAGNRGANWNFNHVVGLARGELFKWAAADDLCRPTFLAQCIEVLDRDPGVVAVHAVTHEIGSNDEPIVRPDPANPRERYNCAGDPELAASASPHLRFRDVMLNHGWGVRCSGVFRLDALRKTGLFEPIYGWEKIMMAELAL